MSKQNMLLEGNTLKQGATKQRQFLGSQYIVSDLFIKKKA